MKELDFKDLQEINGGYLFLIWIAALEVVQIATVGLLAAGLAGSFELGYNSVKKIENGKN